MRKTKTKRLLFAITLAVCFAWVTPVVANTMFLPPPEMKAATPAPTKPVPPPVAAPMAVAPTSPVMNVAAPPVAPSPATTTTSKDTKGKVFGGWVLEILLYIIGTLLAAILPVLTAWAYKKLKLTDLESKDMIDGIVLKAALFGLGKAEEEAHKLHDNPIDGAKKMDIAIASANNYLRDSGLPEKGSKYLADLIESRLGVARSQKVVENKEATNKEVPPLPKK